MIHVTCHMLHVFKALSQDASSSRLSRGVTLTIYARAVKNSSISPHLSPVPLAMSSIRSVVSFLFHAWFMPLRKETTHHGATPPPVHDGQGGADAPPPTETDPRVYPGAYCDSPGCFLQPDEKNGGWKCPPAFTGFPTWMVGPNCWPKDEDDN